MDNWLVKMRKAAWASERAFAEALGLELGEYRYAELHPGRLTLNQVGALSRAVGKERARAMMESISEIYA